MKNSKLSGKNSNQNHDGTQRSVILPFADQSAYLSSLLDDPRIHDIASSICGEEFNYTSGDGNYYVGDTRWHSDGYGARPVLTIKIAFYLDKVTASSGALRVIPGSHKSNLPHPYANKHLDDIPPLHKLPLTAGSAVILTPISLSLSTRFG